MLEPLPYHRAVRDHLRAKAKGVWKYFSSDAFHDKHAEELSLALLKATYRLDRESHASLYDLADEVAAKLGIDVPVELYQGPNDGSLNAALYFVPDAARVVLNGPLEERLEPGELRALLGHELSHHLLYTVDRGELFITARALAALADAQSAASVVETARLYNLATETYADRGGLLASGDRDATIRCLIKVETGLKDADPTAFLAQADEVLTKAGAGSEQQSHPESFIRAKAIALHAEGGDSDAAIRSLLEGKLHIDALDLMRREELAGVSQELTNLLLQPKWFRTDAALGHARLMFDDFQVSAPERTASELAGALTDYGPSILDYLVYLLVDFVAVDPSLDTLALAQAQTLAQELGLLAGLEKLVNKELKITKKAIQAVGAQRAALLEAAERGGGGKP